MTIPSRTGVTAGVTTGPSPDGRSWRRRRRIVAGLVATGLAGTSLLSPGLAAAAPPTFPDNVVVFPDRDFITIEGYQDHIGETAIVEVTRGGTVVGSAQGVVAERGRRLRDQPPRWRLLGRRSPALKVTPDIKAGDVRHHQVRPAPARGDTTVPDAAVTEHAKLSGSTLTVTGTSAPASTRRQLEQRIVNPDLVPPASASATSAPCPAR